MIDWLCTLTAPSLILQILLAGFLAFPFKLHEVRAIFCELSMDKLCIGNSCLLAISSVGANTSSMLRVNLVADMLRPCLALLSGIFSAILSIKEIVIAFAS